MHSFFILIRITARTKYSYPNASIENLSASPTPFNLSSERDLPANFYPKLPIKFLCNKKKNAPKRRRNFRSDAWFS